MPVLIQSFNLAIPNLYHIVFRNEYQEVLVYNNRLEVVKGPIALLLGFYVFI